MKKFFAVAAVILGVVVSQIVVPSQTQAAIEEYLGEWEGGWKAYLVGVKKISVEEHGADMEVYIPCTLKAVSPRGTVKFIEYQITMHYPNGSEQVQYITFVDSEGGSGRFTPENVGDYQVEFEAVKIINRAANRVANR